MPYRLNKPIIRLALERDTLQNLRDWLLVRRYAAGRSGLFTLSQLGDIYTALEINSLSDRSNRAKFKHKKAAQLRGSVFFQHIKGELYRYTSHKRALIAYKKTARHTAYDVPETALTRPGAFLDACIGVISAGGGYSNAGLARLFKISKRRIQKATKENDRTGFIVKRFNKVLEFYPTERAALGAVAELKAHGIESSMPFKLNKDYCITLNTVNGYKSHTLKRYKGKIDRGRDRSICSTPGDWKQWFKPVYRGKGARIMRENTEIKIQGRALMFNNAVYHIGNFILDHSNAI